MLKIRFITFLLFSSVFFSCEENTLPKPSAFLRLEYPEATHNFHQNRGRFSFFYNSNAIVVEKRNRDWIDLKYPFLKATLVLTYSPVKKNLRALLQDAEKLTFKHAIKADDIQSVPYENITNEVYGKMYEVYGNTATQIQFYATDSVANFITGALYFYARPNYDSLYPAVAHLRKDIIHLMETLVWEEQ
jgi:gliding motility-associated lipoprotein GldD